VADGQQNFRAGKEIAPRLARRLVAAQPQLLKNAEAIFVERQLRHVHALESPHLYSGVEPLRSAKRSGRHPISFSRFRSRIN
jgi:hypothetical protein